MRGQIDLRLLFVDLSDRSLTNATHLDQLHPIVMEHNCAKADMLKIPKWNKFLIFATMTFLTISPSDS